MKVINIIFDMGAEFRASEFRLASAAYSGHNPPRVSLFSCLNSPTPALKGEALPDGCTKLKTFERPDMTNTDWQGDKISETTSFVAQGGNCGPGGEIDGEPKRVDGPIEACQDECKKHEDCTGFARYDEICWLKKTDCVRGQGKWVSASADKRNPWVIYRRETTSFVAQGGNCGPGGEIDGEPKRVDGPIEACQDECKKHEDCTGFARYDEICWLKKTDCVRGQGKWVSASADKRNPWVIYRRPSSSQCVQCCRVLSSPGMFQVCQCGPTCTPQVLGDSVRRLARGPRPEGLLAA